jgi:hypothetical protein
MKVTHHAAMKLLDLVKYTVKDSTVEKMRGGAK